MPQTTSSSQPDVLRHYADMLASQGDQIAAEGRRLAAALGRLTDTCREYPLGGIGALGERVQALVQRDAELAGWVRGIAEAFVAADSTSAPPPPPVTCAPVEQPDYVADAAQWIYATAVGLARWRVEQEIHEAQAWVAGGQAAVTTVTTTINRLNWSWAATRLHYSLSFVDIVTELSGDHFVGTSIGVFLSYKVLFPSLYDITRLIIMEDSSRWAQEPVRSPADRVSLFEQSFWQLAFHKLAPDLLLSLAEDIEDLNRRTCDDLGACSNPRPPNLEEASLSPQDMFPDTKADRATGALTLAAWAIMTETGAHSAISSYQNEQLSYMRIGEHEHLFAICGLDLTNMPVSPNTLSAVIKTAYDPDRMANPYYHLIKERFLAYLAQIPPGDTLNITGHSMGGGMAMMLLNDPEVQAALISGRYTLRSVVLYGAVRPMDVHFNGIPPTEPSELAPTLFEGTEVRIYVDPEDGLAMNVGAGHMTSDGLPMPNVYFVDDGNLSGATDAHISYWNSEKYANLPEELQTLPFHVDPRYWEHSRGPDMNDVHLEEWLDSVGSISSRQVPAVA